MIWFGFRKDLLRKSNTINQHAVSDDVLCQSSDIFKLDIKCFKKLFDYLCQKDVIAMGGTCKYLERIAGYCFQKNYSAKDIQCGYKSICINYFDRIDNFNRSICKLRVYHHFDDIHSFRYIQRNCQQLRQIEFANIKLTKPKMECIAKILSKIEFLRIDCCEIDGSFHENVLVFCKNLKRLSIIGLPYQSTIIGSDNDWLRKRYPSLHWLELLRFHAQKLDELIIFLKENSNIKKCSIPMNYVWMNKEAIMDANVKLDKLAVLIYFVTNIKLISVCHLLNQLYDRGFYKSLHFYHISKFDQRFVTHLNSLKALVKLRVPPNKCIELSSLTDLEELRVHRSSDVIDLAFLPNNLRNLKGIHFSNASYDDILLLVSHAANLKKIQVDNIENESNEPINLVELNKERKKLQQAKKLTIYVNEEIYLAAKWSYQDMKMNLIELKRVDSHNWDHAFSFNLF